MRNRNLNSLEESSNENLGEAVSVLRTHEP
jgi:hypothetical protein